MSPGHRKRSATLWQSIPPALKITGAACLVVLVAVTLFLHGRHPATSPPGVRPPDLPPAGKAFDKIVATLAPIDLVLSQSTLNLKTRRIEGVVTNQSAHAYSDINVSFYLPTRDLKQAETIDISLPAIAPHGSIKFATEPLRPEFKQWSLKEIRGTVRP